jgi:hypothetical protein
MNNQLEAIELSTLDQVAGGADKPQSQQPAPQPSDQTQWIKNTVKCTRIGGPVLGAVCGILTPTPAY